MAPKGGSGVKLFFRCLCSSGRAAEPTRERTINGLGLADLFIDTARAALHPRADL